ncbi:MAG: hypothetical protein COA52_00310 [Hyphomicrobiales bacterium]|nr:MAG: hypothetical protein COA52_00310 [Hyphomicrobiales bacterium]
MKYILITDTHFGLQNDSKEFHENMKLFFNDIFFPYIEKNDIDGIIHLGDVFHSRKKIDTDTLTNAKEYFFKPLEKTGLRMDIILGNHDIYYKNSSSVNTPKLVLSEYKNITVHEEAAVIDNILLLPWIHKNNAEATYKIIKSSKETVLMGHLELAGFKLNKAQTAKYGMKSKIFSKFEKVFSGHYHTKSSKDNITYLGAPTQHTWIDVDDQKGFHVFDSNTLELTFIKNPHTMFENVYYENEDIDFSKFKNKMIKLHSSGIESRTHYDKTVSSLEEMGYNIKASETKSSVSDIELSNVEVEDTSDIIKEYIVAMDDIRHEEVHKIIDEIYLEAMSI